MSNYFIESVLNALKLNSLDPITDLLNPNIQDNYGKTALMYACEYGGDISLDIIKILIDYGADPNIQDNEGDTALMHLMDPDRNDSDEDRINKINLLLNAGAEINIQNNQGDTVLHKYIEYIPPSMLQFLIKKGVYPDIKNNDGHTALMKILVDWYDVHRDYLNICLENILILFNVTNDKTGSYMGKNVYKLLYDFLIELPARAEVSNIIFDKDIYTSLQSIYSLYKLSDIWDLSSCNILHSLEFSIKNNLDKKGIKSIYKIYKIILAEIIEQIMEVDPSLDADAAQMVLESLCGPILRLQN